MQAGYFPKGLLFQHFKLQVNAFFKLKNSVYVFIFVVCLFVCFRKMNILLYGTNENVIALDTEYCW